MSSPFIPLLRSIIPLLIETRVLNVYLLDLHVYSVAVHVRLANKAVTRSHDISLIDNVVEAHIEASQNVGKHNIQLCVGQAIKDLHFSCVSGRLFGEIGLTLFQYNSSYHD